MSVETARVLKYPIPIDGRWHEVPLAYGPNMPRAMWHVGFQDHAVMIWLRPHTEDNPETQRVKVVGTGHEYDARDFWVGTVQDPYGFVWHVIAEGDR